MWESFHSLPLLFSLSKWMPTFCEHNFSSLYLSTITVNDYSTKLLTTHNLFNSSCLSELLFFCIVCFILYGMTWNTTSANLLSLLFSTQNAIKRYISVPMSATSKQLCPILQHWDKKNQLIIRLVLKIPDKFMIIMGKLIHAEMQTWYSV